MVNYFYSDYKWVRTAEALNTVLFQCMGHLIYKTRIKSWSKFKGREVAKAVVMQSGIKT